MTNIDRIALDIARSDNPEKVLTVLLAVLEVLFADDPSSALKDMDKALDMIEVVAPKMLEEAKEAKEARA